MSACPLTARPALAAALLALAPLAALASTTLYDPALGSLPSAQGWLPLVFGGFASEGLADGFYALDTGGAGVSYWGNRLISPLAVDTQAGFDLSFSLQLLSESHSRPNRAGFALMLVGAQATQALELEFWVGNNWAQKYDASQPDRFVHDSDVAFDTTAALTPYTLAMRPKTGILLINFTHSRIVQAGEFNNGRPCRNDSLVYARTHQNRKIVAPPIIQHNKVIGLGSEGI